MSVAIPLHRTIEQALRERVAGLRPGDRLPSDAGLCKEFGVSRMTARGAMQRLADEGLVVRIPGRGSFVADRSPHRRADRLMSFSAEMARTGRAPSSVVLLREIRPADRVAMADLGVRLGEPIVVVRRLRLADGVPVAIETARLAGRTSAAVTAADLGAGSLHAALAGAGFTLRRGWAVVTADSTTPEEARLLNITRGTPVLVERRVILDGDGMPVEATESRYVADRYAIEMRFDVEDAPPATARGPDAAR